MHLTRENIAGYLLTLQLVEAGYHITYDEMLEMYSAKKFLKNWEFSKEYTITYEQNISWFKKASKILQNTFHWHPRECDKYVSWIDLASGLSVKNNMSNNKQSSVDWLVEQFEESHSYINEIFKETIEQAKEMHKSEVTEAFYIGRYEYNNFDSNSTEYYNETFGNNIP